MIVYLNRDEKYGDTHIVTLADYQEFEPDAKFEYDYQYGMDVILRRKADINDPWDIVAVGYDSENDESQFENELEILPDHLIQLIKNEWAIERQQREVEGVMTAGEIDKLYTLPTGSARRDANRGKFLTARKSGGTWLVHRSEAADYYGKLHYYISVEHANGDNAYATYGHDFSSIEDAIDYLTSYANLDRETYCGNNDFAGTIYVFDDETLEGEPYQIYQPTKIKHPAGLYVVEFGGGLH